MSFDLVSYAMGKQAGGGGGSLTDLDQIAFGNSPTLPDEGKTDPDNYEAIAEAINTAKARGNAVTVEDVTITSNGQTSAPSGKAYKNVTVNVPRGYVGYHDTLSGTLANPWGGSTFDDVKTALSLFMATTKAWPYIEYDASAISAGTGGGAMYINGNNITAIGAEVTSSTSSAFTMIWDSNGLVSAYMAINGTITDLSPYASLITTTIYLPTTGGNN